MDETGNESMDFNINALETDNIENVDIGDPQIDGSLNELPPVNLYLYNGDNMNDLIHFNPDSFYNQLIEQFDQPDQNYETAPSPHTASPAFIPINSDTKQIQGSAIIRTAENDHNVQPGTIVYELSIPPNLMPSTTADEGNIGKGEEDKVTLSNGMTNSAENASLINDTNQDDAERKISTTPAVPTRKRSGRKPKPKLAEGDMGIGEESNVNPSKTSSTARQTKRQRKSSVTKVTPKLKDQEKETPCPNLTVHHYSTQQIPSGPSNQLPFISLYPDSRHPSPGTLHHVPAGRFSNISLEQLACQDRNDALARRMAVTEGMNETTISQGRPPSSYGYDFRHDESGRTQMDHMRGSDEVRDQVAYVTHQSMGNRPHQLMAESQQGNRLEQMFTRRISDASGPPKRSTVTPSFIKSNLSLYNQLTTPLSKQTVGFFDNHKVMQKKWGEVPNPSGVNNTMNDQMQSENGRLEIENRRHRHQIQNPSTASSATVSSFTQRGSGYMIDRENNCSLEGVGSQRNLMSNGGVEMSFTNNGDEMVGYGSLERILSSGNTNSRFRSQSIQYETSRMRRPGSSYSHSRITANLRYKILELTNCGMDHKLKYYHQMKLNKCLLERCRILIEENELLRANVVELRQQIRINRSVNMNTAARPHHYYNYPSTQLNSMSYELNGVSGMSGSNNAPSRGRMGDFEGPSPQTGMRDLNASREGMSEFFDVDVITRGGMNGFDAATSLGEVDEFVSHSRMPMGGSEAPTGNFQKAVENTVETVQIKQEVMDPPDHDEGIGSTPERFENSNSNDSVNLKQAKDSNHQVEQNLQSSPQTEGAFNEIGQQKENVDAK